MPSPSSWSDWYREAPGPVEIDACISKLQEVSVQMLAQLTLLESIELATAYPGEGR
jgi:hypothetical protein